MNKTLEQAIIQAVANQLGNDFLQAKCRRSGEGCINETWELYGEHIESLFLKVGRKGYEPMYAKEFISLEELKKAEKFHVPTPLLCGVIEDECAFLVMEFITLSSLRRSSEIALGEALAEMHSITSDRFGFVQDNYIGRSLQPNGWSDSWWPFFIDKRLQHQLAMAEQNGLRQDLLAGVSNIIARLPGCFTDHQPSPVLLHGDLWVGNIAADSHGRPVIYDPALYYGDAETDIAMSQMFGALGQAVYDAYYGNIRPLEGNELRRPLYDLYHWLNHFNLFGTSYVTQIDRVVKQLSYVAG